MPFEAPNRNLFWTRLVVEELVRSGVDTFYIAPGSRSSPLVTAVAHNPNARAFVHFDERGSAFRALGYARLTRRPAVWITTSGSALANGMPAVVEASMDEVPLLMLTADRPPELRETGANQTIRQPNLFGSYVQWSFDLPCASVEMDPAFVLTTIDHAVFRTRRGPVHLNCMFREPLAGTAEVFDFPEKSPRMSRWLGEHEPYTRYEESAADLAGAAKEIEEALARSSRPILSIGRLPQNQSQSVVLGHVVRLASRLEMPVFPDICSGVRLGVSMSEDAVISYYDVLLESREVRESLKPDLIVQFGSTPVSSRLQKYIQEAGADLIVVSGVTSRLDPAHMAGLRIQAEPENVIEFMAGNTSDSRGAIENVGENSGANSDQVLERARWFSQWRRLGSLARHWHAENFDDSDNSTLTEQMAAVIVSRVTSTDSQLVLGNSLPVRHMNSMGWSEARVRGVVCNRGASGIDGTIATAAGVRDGTGSRVTVFLGDLSLLHDLNSLSLARECELTIVVLNNDGGGIFSWLPIANQPEVFERFFATPHGYDFEQAASMFNLSYAGPRTPAQLEDALKSAARKGGGALIEIRTNREENVQEQHRLLLGLVQQIKR